jgi:aryl-alcohol dehydrogenase-like predicted oxidoreductase
MGATATAAHLEDNLAAAALQLRQDEIDAITAAASRVAQPAAQAS